jgi:hypothetical protein
LSQILNTYFNIKTFRVIPYQDIVRCKYKLMVDGVWYNHTDENNLLSELNIVINFPVNYEVNEQELTELSNLNTALAKLSGDKSNITNIIPRLKEKGKLKRQLLNQYQQNLEEDLLKQEKNKFNQDITRIKAELLILTKQYNATKISIKDATERLNVLYKDIKDHMEDAVFDENLKKYQKNQENLLNTENQCKIEIDMLKEDLTYYSKQLKKPFTQIELDSEIKRNADYQKINREIIEISNVLDYIEHLDKSQDEKSLVTRAIKGLFQKDSNINFT